MRTSEVRKRQQLSLQELYQINWILGAILALLSIGTAFYLDAAARPHLVGGCFLIGISIIRPQLTTYIPRILWQTIPFLLVILLAVDLHFSGEPVPALIRLNLLLVLYRCLAFRRKREDLQLVVLCLFLIIIVGVMTVSFTFPLQVLLFTVVAMSFLFNVTLMEDSRDELVPREIWRHFTWRRFLWTIRTRLDSGFFLVAGIAFSSVALFAVLLFVAIPRVDFHGSLPFAGMKRGSQTGFSEQIRFGDVTNIRNDNRVAMRVEVETEDQIPADPYWRMLVLDEYIGGGFRLSHGLQYNARMEQRLREIRKEGALVQREEPTDEENLWTIYLESGVARYLPLTGRFNRIRFQDSRDFVYIPQAEVLGIPQANKKMLVYQIEDMEFNGISRDPDFGTYTLDYEWYPELGMGLDFDYQPYPETTMALPLWPDDIQYLRDLVDEIGGGEALTALEFADRATEYLQERHSYSMSYDVPPSAGDHVVRWLKSGEAGHCEAFAGALLLICRSAGIPSRIVTGFQGGVWNAYENYFMVRNSDAHAWVEIFDGQDSWIRVDPTPGATAPVGQAAESEEREQQVVADSSFAAYVDSLRILWYRRIVNFDQSSQSKIWSFIQNAYDQVQLKERFTALKEAFITWWRGPWNFRQIMELVGFTAAGGLVVVLSFFIARQMKTLFRFSSHDPVRKQSGRLLLRLKNLPPPREHREEREEVLGQLIAELRHLRYGRPENRGDWRNVLRRARRFARSWR